MNYTYSSSLYHHGVKGQKWGVRRYRNKDGSLTSAGKKKASKERIDTQSEDAKRAAQLSTKKTSELSNKELAELNTRKGLEKKRSELYPGSFKKGMAFAAGATAVMGTAIALYNNTDRIVKIGKTIADKAFSGTKNVAMNLTTDRSELMNAMDAIRNTLNR